MSSKGGIVGFAGSKYTRFPGRFVIQFILNADIIYGRPSIGIGHQTFIPPVGKSFVNEFSGDLFERSTYHIVITLQISWWGPRRHQNFQIVSPYRLSVFDNLDGFLHRIRFHIIIIANAENIQTKFFEK